MNEPEYRYHQDRAFIAYCRRASIRELWNALADEMTAGDEDMEWKLCAIERGIRRCQNEEDQAATQNRAPALEGAREEATDQA